MAKKTAGTGAPLNKTPQLSAVEREARGMLDDGDEGNIDNVFDVLEDMMSIEERLPAGSQLRQEWDDFYASMMKIVEDSAK